jgi:hypothetical protein
MKFILILLIIFLSTACRNYLSPEEMQDELQVQLQQEFDQAKEFKSYQLHVIDLHLTKWTSGVYQGQSYVEYAGQQYPISLLVQVTDDQEYIIDIPNEDFGFLDDVELENYRAQLEQDFQMLVGSFDMNAPYDEIQDDNQNLSAHTIK